MRIITCPVCTEPYPLYLFEFGIPFWCRCGAIIGRPTEDLASPRRQGGSQVGHRQEGSGSGSDPGRDRTLEPEGGSFPDPRPEPAYDDRDFDPDLGSESRITLSEDEWLELRAELEARDREKSLPGFDWPYEYDVRFDWPPRDDRRAKELQRRADRICYLISATNRPAHEIEREQRQLAERCQRYFPEIEQAYERIYDRRFRELWRQFREG